MRKPISRRGPGIREEHYIMTPSEGVHSVAKSVPSEHRPLPGQVVLVMQGGGAPGCYQAGVYQAMHEAGIEPDWVIGTSIGAINGAIIAGNKDADRLERLHEFWSCLEGWCAGPWGSLTTLLTGVPGLFSLTPVASWGVETRV